MGAMVQKANAEAAQKEQQKAERKRMEARRNVEFLTQQIEDKERKKQEAPEQKKQQHIRVVSDTNAYHEESKEKFTANRQKNINYRLELEQQIDSRKREPARVREDKMSTTEAYINKGLVHQAGQYAMA